MYLNEYSGLNDILNENSFCIWSGFLVLKIIKIIWWQLTQSVLASSRLHTINSITIQFSLVAHFCLFFATPWTAACQASLSNTYSRSLLKLMSIESVIPSDHLILSRPLILLPSIFPSIRVFSSESVLYIRWPKYWSISPSILKHVSYYNEVFLWNIYLYILTYKLTVFLPKIYFAISNLS